MRTDVTNEMFTDELIKFADDISKHFDISDDKKYHVRIVKRIVNVNTGVPINTAIRISNKSGIIELDKTLLSEKEFKPDFIFLGIIWCIAIHEYGGGFEGKADMAALKIYLQLGRPQKDVLIGWNAIFSKADTENNRMRFKNMVSYLKDGVER